ncbi:MAG TPA: glutamine synthetase, partial [Actinobacteria bacterium]|nr:glutamine synthetase [Actinomycetota bacterium]
MPSVETGRLSTDHIKADIERGDIDTILLVFPDQQGRFVGKRLTGDFFLHDILEGEGAIHACNYLLAVDMEMEPLPGYAYASWDTGYGDLKAVPDMTTLRRIPWLEKTALVICDVLDEETNEPVEVAPRQILRRQLERATAAGYTVKTGSELEFYLFRDSFEEAAGKGYRGVEPHSTYIMDYHI